jgi:hypothetical protein
MTPETTGEALLNEALILDVTGFFFLNTQETLHIFVYKIVSFGFWTYNDNVLLKRPWGLDGLQLSIEPS